MMPVEKLRLRPWLEGVLNSGRIPGVKWIDPRDKVFQVSWKHASRHGWCVETDACIFKEWAVHTGRYRESLDKPDPRRWKANFRCALNALPDIKELQARGVTRGNNAFKVYQMLRKNTEIKEKDRIKNERDVASKINSKAIHSKCSKAVVRTIPQQFKRHSVIHKSTSVIHGDSSLPVCTTHPINPQSFFQYWPTNVYQHYQHPHMKDHDYLTTWYDPRPEMKDIGVMTYQDIKKEPGSPDSHSNYCNDQYNQDSEGIINEANYENNAKQEKAVPSDEEIVDLVDSMSRDSDSLSHRSDSSSFDDYDPEMNDQEQYSQSPSRASPQRPSSLDLPTKQDLTSEYEMSYDYQKTPPPPLTPESTSEILKGITSPVNQSG